MEILVIVFKVSQSGAALIFLKRLTFMGHFPVPNQGVVLRGDNILVADPKPAEEKLEPRFSKTLMYESFDLKYADELWFSCAPLDGSTGGPVRGLIPSLGSGYTCRPGGGPWGTWGLDTHAELGQVVRGPPPQVMRTWGRWGDGSP